jgi:hypothetical protein
MSGSHVMVHIDVLTGNDFAVLSDGSSEAADDGYRPLLSWKQLPW